MTAIEAAGDFGPRMKRLREQRGVSLREIAECTKISVRTLEALERDDVAQLPGGIFSRSIVRAYADAIGSDPEGAVRDFTSRFPVESVFPGAAPAETRRIYLLITAGVVAVIPLVAALVWLLTNRTAR
jgi:cytoskeletal protein RodZ